MHSLFLGFIYSPNLYVGLHIQTIIFKMLGFICRPLFSSAFCYLGYICRPFFIMGFCSRRKHTNQSFGLYICSILFRYSQSFGLYIQSIFLGFFFLLLIMGFICWPYCVCWFVFWAIYTAHYHTSVVRGFYGAKIGVAHWGLRG